jgi:hypothetical protein
MSKSAKIIISLGIFAFFVIGVGAFAFLQTSKAEEPISETPVLGVTAAPEPEPRTILEIVMKPVFVKVPGATEAVPAVQNQEVVAGTTISTGEGGRAQVIFPNHTVTRLDENTEIVLEKDSTAPSNILIKLKKNRIWSRISTIVGLDSFETQSANALAAVRGTSYGHETSEEGDKIITTKGTVTGECIENPDDEQPIKSGTKSSFDCENNKIKNEPINEKDKKDEWFTYNQEEDKKLNDEFGASTYGDEGDVLGISDVVPPTPTPTLRLASRTTETLIDCTGPDRKTFKATRADCDNLNKFWQEHPPAANPPAANSNNNPSPSSNNSSPNPTATPLPTPTPIPVEYPLVTNLVYSPNVFDGQSPCSISTTFHVHDPAGLTSLFLEWEISDGASPGEPTRSFIAEFNGQTDYDATFTIPLMIPPNGKLFWRIIADGNTQDAATTTEGTPIQETTSRGCNGAQ